ncbi:hypothetical protein CU097_009173 [Rhizopus azygosporus]|uniref:Retrotransposon gag domain-containing protein n=1 Tax=Rhizopus azygosporus TaxID=86630 RepID=A0A367JCS3_RHIAZ|nr:hypothetical protein CU097_009173 [Rhizopus azygosporus]
MATIHKDLVFFEGRIADIQKLISGKRGSTVNTHTVPAREAESVVPMTSISSLRLLNDFTHNSKYFESNKAHPVDASTDKAFKTIGAFLDKFELTLAYHRVNIGKEWYNYLQTSVQDGQDSRYIKWLKQRDQEANFKSSKWLEVREMLIEKFYKSFSYLQYKEKMMRCKQRKGEYMHLYIERFLDLVTKPSSPIILPWYQSFSIHCWIPYANRNQETRRHEKGRRNVSCWALCLRRRDSRAITPHF